MKIKFFLLISSLVFAIVNTQDQTTILPTDLSCEVTTPTRVEDCTQRKTNTGNKCCYLSGTLNYANEKLCLSLPPSTYAGRTSFYYSGKTYNINCQDNTHTPTILKSCGPKDITPTGKADCSTGSSFVNSCCWFAGINSSTSPKGCYWLGTKYSGDTTWGGLELNCNATFLSFSLSLLFFFLAALF